MICLFDLIAGGPIVRSNIESEAQAISTREPVVKRRCIDAGAGNKLICLERENF